MESSNQNLLARRIHLTGVVQGVGMRPTVYRHAQEAQIGGWVLNGVGGVTIHAVGTASQLDHFEEILQAGWPPQARIETYSSQEAQLEPEDRAGCFGITKSDDQDGSEVFVSPDIATCPQCCKELFDPDNRRYRYPFINCTDCGPRFTVIADLPYDRPKTSMAVFDLCPECNEEYHNPADRRFDAQPDACFMCGPQLEWRMKDKHLCVDAESLEERRAQSDAILAACCQALSEGKIVALKGLGGFHLACDASNEEAVQRLRKGKKRSDKAFALMLKDVESASELVEINAKERQLLSGSIRPIVLLKRKYNPKALSLIAPSICFDLDELGIMLPYTPLHHLLLHDFGKALVMTSGNISDESICIDEQEALSKLSKVADAFLLHNRKILARYDDSVVRIVNGEEQIIRRARGLAPSALKLPPALVQDAADKGLALESVFALGPQQKHCFCITRSDAAFVSQHLGDLEDAQTLKAFHEAEQSYLSLFRLKPTRLAADMHPSYLSTLYAQDLHKQKGWPLDYVQHHHAHIVACTAEHNYEQDCLGIALDGTGYGEDGTLWGGEILHANWSSYKRLAHLPYLSLVGGQAAIKEPLRIAYAFLYEHDLLEHPAAGTVLKALETGQAKLLSQMIDKKINCPQSSSAGRFLDLASSLMGICHHCSYEGEAAILLEACAQRLKPSIQEALREEIYSHEPFADPFDLLKELLDKLASNQGGSQGLAKLAYWLHIQLVHHLSQTACRLAQERGLECIALSGGCFMNRILLTELSARIKYAGLKPLVSQKLPQNDACIAYGQAVVALARSLNWGSIQSREETICV